MANTAGRLAGQVAVVTGGGRGIGAAISRRLAELGISVVLCGRTATSLEETAKSIGQAGNLAEAIPCDVVDHRALAEVARTVRSKYGRLDVLVNNAGVGAFAAPLHEFPLEDWDRILNTNLRGVFYAIRAFAPLMIERRYGHIVNISSLAGKNPLPKGAAYAASKWGLNGLTYSVAEELRAYNIRVSVVCPGSTNTDLSPHEGKDPNRMLQPDDVAHVVEMLVTQSAQSFASEVLLRPTMKP
ncbi:MAG TPA: SDR family NAD(P)-dependent oxidoreductase [Terriglobales bacterium]|nr:SDR family NAD(P)-dependent oxidoreductase [Terriglobales bacterium]